MSPCYALLADSEMFALEKREKLPLLVAFFPCTQVAFVLRVYWRPVTFEPHLVEIVEALLPSCFAYTIQCLIEPDIFPAPEVAGILSPASPPPSRGAEERRYLPLYTCKLPTLTLQQGESYVKIT